MRNCVFTSYPFLHWLSATYEIIQRRVRNELRLSKKNCIPLKIMHHFTCIHVDEDGEIKIADSSVSHLSHLSHLSYLSSLISLSSLSSLIISSLSHLSLSLSSLPLPLSSLSFISLLSLSLSLITLLSVSLSSQLSHVSLSLSLHSSLFVFLSHSCLSLSLSLFTAFSLPFHLNLFLSPFSCQHSLSLLNVNDNDHLFSRLSLSLHSQLWLTLCARVRWPWPIRWLTSCSLRAKTCCLGVPAKTSRNLKEVDLYLRWRWRCSRVFCGVGCICVCVCVCLCGCCRRCGVACLLLSGGLSAACCLLYLDIQSRRGDIICLPLRGSWLLLPVVRSCLNFSPRWHSELSVEITVCQQHLRPSQKRTQRPGKSGYPRAISNLSWVVKNTTEVERAVQKNGICNRTKLLRWGFISITVLLMQKNISVRKNRKWLWI